MQQDGAPAHTACQTQDWLRANCTDFIAKDEWPPNSPDFKFLTHLTTMCGVQYFGHFTNFTQSPIPFRIAKKCTAADLE